MHEGSALMTRSPPQSSTSKATTLEIKFQRMNFGGTHSIQNKQLSAPCALDCLGNGDGIQYLDNVHV